VGGGGQGGVDNIIRDFLKCRFFVCNKVKRWREWFC